MEKTKELIVAALILSIVSVSIVVAMGIQVSKLTETIDHQDKLLANVTILTKVYQEVFVAQQLEINMIKNNTENQVRFNLDVGEWSFQVQERLEALESQR